MKHRSKIPLIFLVLPLLVSLACNFSMGGSDSESETDTSDVAPTSETSGSIRTIPTSESGVTPTSLPAISSSSDTESMDDELVMKEPIFIQDGTNLITVFLFENTDTAGVEDIEYTVTASDVNGTIIETDTGSIDFIAAGTTTGVASQMYLDEGVTVENVDIDWTYYVDASGSNEIPFTFENARYYFDPFWDRFTAVMVNNSSDSFTNVRVDMIAYDAAGMVIGGGYSLVNFIPGDAQVGVSINGFVSDDPCADYLVPGCVCPSGYFLHDDQCVRPESCPCIYQHRTYHPGDTIHIECNEWSV